MKNIKIVVGVLIIGETLKLIMGETLKLIAGWSLKLIIEKLWNYIYRINAISHEPDAM